MLRRSHVRPPFVLRNTPAIVVPAYSVEGVLGSISMYVAPPPSGPFAVQVRPSGADPAGTAPAATKATASRADHLIGAASRPARRGRRQARRCERACLERSSPHAPVPYVGDLRPVRRVGRLERFVLEHGWRDVPAPAPVGRHGQDTQPVGEDDSPAVGDQPGMRAFSVIFRRRDPLAPTVQIDSCPLS